MSTVFFMVMGFTFSIVCGHAVVSKFSDWFAHEIEKECRGWEIDVNICQQSIFRVNILAATVGHVERIFFTVATIISPASGPAVMVGWLALKMATNWHPYSSSSTKCKEESQVLRAKAMGAVSSGLLSMLFALFGGLLCRLGL
ncbi:hypothetical protein [Desulfatibacillum aliphaticivorans]|uniref:hypothetical protein n=1 Tax=Desulfatibacillum aliphaticivorans TaxID=218208 RepID=UPI0012FBA5AF|nr:hypothetical protein [Desulfatibacillum aliphaticivorans]